MTLNLRYKVPRVACAAQYQTLICRVYISVRNRERAVCTSVTPSSCGQISLFFLLVVWGCGPSPLASRTKCVSRGSAKSMVSFLLIVLTQTHPYNKHTSGHHWRTAFLIFALLRLYSTAYYSKVRNLFVSPNKVSSVAQYLSAWHVSSSRILSHPLLIGLLHSRVQHKIFHS